MAVQPERLLTYDDYASFPDDGLRHEIIAGKDYILGAPNVRHQNILLRLAHAFMTHLERGGGGQVFVAPCDVVLGEHDVVQPDVIFVADDRLQIITEPNIQGAPTLAVEVLSDARHDRIRKRDLYAAAGIPTYWIAAPASEWVEVYRLHDGAYGKPELFTPGETLTLPELPGFAVSVEALFA